MLTADRLNGIHVPVITPFQKNGELDLPSYRSYLTELLKHRIQGIVIGGTTGESPSLAWDELKRLYEETEQVMAAQHNRLPITVGTGTNDTASTLRRTEQAKSLGADAVLVVVPYYNRPAPSGILEHFRRTAEIEIPVIAYNIPYRTGVELSIETVKQILDLPNVIGLKDSSGGIRQLIELSRSVTKPILCGEDMYFYSALCSGARGGIVASSSVAADILVRVYESIRAGHPTEARKEFERLVPLIDLLYREPNPAPIKWLLAHRGIIQSSTLRLPMTEISASLQTVLQEH
jgi:4-hydroxy-tetrahydrodipicolinate synthase